MGHYQRAVASYPQLRGTVLDGRYQIVDVLGEGGMGRVYEALHVTLDRKLAIKTLHPRLAYDARFRERFLREAKAASTIRHPNVVQIMDFGDTPDGSVYFVMEFLEGRDLRSVLKERGKLPWAEAQPILQQAVSALSAAHAHSIIHRDIKPGNCFLTPIRGIGEVVKLLDFGIAKVTSEAGASANAAELTGTGEVFGTATYMAPEQARGLPLDARSDIYSLGIMAYEVLTGQVPFTGVNAIHVITRHLNDEAKPPRSLEPSIPPAVEALVLKAMAKQPDDRFASMAELEAAIMEADATAVPPPPTRTRRPRKTVMWGDSARGQLGGAKPDAGAKPGSSATPPRRSPPPTNKSIKRAGSLAAPPAIPGASVARPPAAPPLTPPPIRKPDVPTPRSKVETAPAAEATTSKPAADRPKANTPAAPPARPRRRVTLVADEPPARPAIKRTLLSDEAPVRPAVKRTLNAEASGELRNPLNAEASGVVAHSSDGTNPPPSNIHEPTSPSMAMVLGTGPLAQQSGSGATYETDSHVLEAAPRRRRTAAILLGIAGLAAASTAITVAVMGDDDAPTTVSTAAQPPGASAPAQAADSPASDAHDEQTAPEHPTAARDDSAPLTAVVEDVTETAQAVPTPQPHDDAVEVDPPPPPPVPDSPPEEIEQEEQEDPIEQVEEFPDEVPPAIPPPGEAPPDNSEDVLVIEDDGQPRRPNHLTEACAERRAKAASAKQRLAWAEVLKATSKASCWTMATQSDRKALRVQAYANTGKYKKCVATGKSLKNAMMQALVKRCQERLQ